MTDEVGIAIIEGAEAVSRAIKDVGISPNEADVNLEPANIVDGLFAVARALNRVADALFEA